MNIHMLIFILKLELLALTYDFSIALHLAFFAMSLEVRGA